MALYYSVAMKKTAIRPPVKYHGGKWYLRNWILSNFPDHKTYVEGFGGAATILLNKQPAEREIYNDLEYSVYNLMLVLKTQLPELLKIVREIPYDKDVYLNNRAIYFSDEFRRLNPLEQAVVTLVVRRMSRGGLCGTFSRSDRNLKSGTNAEVNAWLTAVHDLLPLVSERLSCVELRNEDAMSILQEYDSCETLYYLDPPYLRDTRVFQNAYIMEMTDLMHRQLADVVSGLRGKVLVSGYPSALYSSLYKDWRIICREIPNHSSHLPQKGVMVECLWGNF